MMAVLSSIHLKTASLGYLALTAVNLGKDGSHVNLSTVGYSIDRISFKCSRFSTGG